MRTDPFLEEGKATSPRSEDGQPIVLDFTSYVVVATSNAGSKEVDGQSAEGNLDPAARKKRFLQLLKTYFPSELLGRFTDQLVFDFPTNEVLVRAAQMYGERQLAQFLARCRDRQQPEPEIFVDPAIYQNIARMCDPALGVRRVRQTVEGVFKRIWLNKYEARIPRPDRVEFLGSDVEHDAELV